MNWTQRTTRRCSLCSMRTRKKERKVVKLDGVFFVSALFSKSPSFGFFFRTREVMEWSDRGQENLAQAKRLHTGAIDYYRKHDLIRATKNIEEALRLRKVALPESHPQIIATQEFLINLYGQQGKTDYQLAHLRHLVELKKLRFGRYHAETEQTMVQLADALSAQGKKTESDEISHEVWKMRAMPSTMRQNLDFEDVLNNLGNSNVRRVDHKKLVDHFFGLGAEPKVRHSPFADDDSWMRHLKERLELQRRTSAMFASPGSPGEVAEKEAEPSGEGGGTSNDVSMAGGAAASASSSNPHDEPPTVTEPTNNMASAAVAELQTVVAERAPGSSSDEQNPASVEAQTPAPVAASS